MEYNAEKKEIILNRKLSDLDNFVIDFIEIVKKHVKYVIISGYVSILLGRSRSTEDVDLFIKKMNEFEFLKMYEELDKHGFWCINTSNPKEMFSYLIDGLAIRFARKNNSIPNFEVKFPKDTLDESSFEDNLLIILPENKKLIISSLERHIAFKKHYLGSDKDMEDAVYVEHLFKDKIDYDKVNKLVSLIKLRNKLKKRAK